MEMATLSGTPTSIISTEPGGVSIKIEQGVLYENSYDKGSKAVIRDVPKVMHDSNPLPATAHIFNGASDDYSLFNITHSIFQPDFSIKSEPGVDIDDRQYDGEAEENTGLGLQSTNVVFNKVPKIRPTPTSKLIASTNGMSENKRRYVCTYDNCTKSYGKSSHLRSHLTWHTGIKPFVCKEPGCGKCFTRSDELNRHIRTHTGEKPFECVQCTKKFSRSDHLTKHLATHSKQMSANSPLTKKIKTDKNLSPSNLKTLPTTSPLGMSCNQNSQETNLIDCSAPNTDCSKATCEDSLKIKEEIPENSADYLIAMSNREQILNPCSSVQAILPKNECNLIIKPEPVEGTQLSGSLEELNEPDDDAIMPEANLPPISQNTTLMPVAVKAEGTCHLKDPINQMADSVYDPTRPFPCCHCAKNFKRQDDLNRHMRTHTGEKPFACSGCEKRFMRSDHLKKHLKTHTKPR